MEEHRYIDAHELQLRYPTRDEKMARMREIEKKIGRMEMEDENNDPRLIEGHIRLQRGYRYGCGVIFFCIAIMSVTVVRDGHRWAAVPAILFFVIGGLSVLTGFLFRPSVDRVYEAYTPHRKTPEYRELIEELGYLAKALAQDLQPEDEDRSGEK